MKKHIEYDENTITVGTSYHGCPTKVSDECNKIIAKKAQEGYILADLQFVAERTDYGALLIFNKKNKS